MKVFVSRTSDWKREYSKTVEMETLQDLWAFVNENGSCVVETPYASNGGEKPYDLSLEIYDDYRE